MTCKNFRHFLSKINKSLLEAADRMPRNLLKKSCLFQLLNWNIPEQGCRRSQMVGLRYRTGSISNRNGNVQGCLWSKDEWKHLQFTYVYKEENVICKRFCSSFRRTLTVLGVFVSVRYWNFAMEGGLWSLTFLVHQSLALATSFAQKMHSNNVIWVI